MEKIPLSQTHQYTILYFYPKDNTPGCTLEAQDFTRLNADFEALGVEIFGVSRCRTKIFVPSTTWESR